MRRNLLILVLMSVVILFSNLNAQFVANGWQVTTEIKASADLIGAWEVIAGYDLDNDGNQEFFFTTDPSVSGNTVSSSTPWAVYYYENTGDDTYEQRWTWSPATDNVDLRSYPAIAVGDVDQDGLAELWFDTPRSWVDDPPNPDLLFVFEFDGSTFPDQPSESWNMGVSDFFLFINSGMSLGDVDGDGDIEMVFQSRRDDFTGGEAGRTMIVANTGGLDIGLGFGAFTAEFTESEVFKGGAVYDPRIIDFDGDGIQEIWILTWDMISLAIYEGTAADTYELQVDINQVFNPLDYGHRRGARFYDVNNDGKLEMYSSALSGDGLPGSVVFYIGSIDDVANLTAEDVKILGGKNQDPGHGGSAIGDIDGDGLMDFLYTAYNPEALARTQVYRVEYKGSGDLADSTSYEWSLFFEDTLGDSDLRNLAIADLDGDEKMEVLITNLDVESTDDAIVYIIERSDPVSVERTSEVIKDFALHQNYPNPFNPSTTIEFDVQTDERVVLTVYDLEGRWVTTLFDKQLSPGTYKTTFNGENLPSGIYIYELRTGNRKLTEKMTLAK